MTDTNASPRTDIACIARLALSPAAQAVVGDDVATEERWLKVARSAGLDPADAMETKGETLLGRRASRDRLMAVLARRFERISLQMQEDADGIPRPPPLSSADTAPD